jgi:tripartite-type tricarboxylate transporter receptor subunit TctC
MMRTFVRFMSAAALVAPLVCAAQDFPAKGKVITQIVPFGAGGGADITARAVQPWLEKELGVSMPIINKPGGGGQVGFTEFLKTAKPDGYTIVWALLPGTPASYLDPKRQAKFTRQDFKLVANVALDPVSIVVKPDSKFKNLQDLVAAAKAGPGKIRATSAGVMVTSHVGAIQIELATGAKFAHLFYEQQGEQRAALLGGHADVEFNPVSETAAEITSGQLRALALCDGQPSRYVPQVPTAISQGVKCSVASVRGIAVPAGTPDNVVSALANAVRKVLADPENQKQLDKIKLATRFMAGKEYEEYWAETEKTVAAGLKATQQK